MLVHISAHFLSVPYERGGDTSPLALGVHLWEKAPLYLAVKVSFRVSSEEIEKIQSSLFWVCPARFLFLSP